MGTALEDFRHGLRLLRKSPLSTLAAVMTLTLGIDANTAIYSRLDQTLLRSMPVKEPNRLVLLASFVPARRATKVQPMVELRYE